MEQCWKNLYTSGLVLISWNLKKTASFSLFQVFFFFGGKIFVRAEWRVVVTLLSISLQLLNLHQPLPFLLLCEN